MMDVKQVVVTTVVVLLAGQTLAATHGSRREERILTLEPSNGGTWGSWGTTEFCPDGSYVTGYQIKVEPPRGHDDDTALNAIRLYCRDKNDVTTGSITSSQQSWGTWQGKEECRSTFMKGFRLRVEPHGGHDDDTAANSLDMMCENGDVLAGGGDSWGSWSEWVECPDGQAIVGLQTKVEGHQGHDDDTALNSVIMYCFPVL